jgi:homospermidine synthase
VEYSTVTRVPFEGKILMLGCGSVAQCTLPLLLRHVIRPDQITVMDMVDNRARIADEIAAGVTYVIDQVERHNLGEVLGKYLTKGDILMDLAWNIDACEIIQWAHDAGVMYMNSSVERWDSYTDAHLQDPRDRSLYVRHMDVRRMAAGWAEKGPTAVLEHGANPGLVSHLTKDALITIAKRAIKEGKAGDAASLAAIETALATKAFNNLAMALGVKVIHIAERDTQISNQPKEVDEFCNTWSVEGLHEEGVAPAELGWGTHEIRLPEGAYLHQSGPSNQIALASMGIDTHVRTWTPLGEVHGMVVRHGEAFTISDHLTVWDGDRAIYRPTVHYAYCPTDAAIASLHELRCRHLVMQSRARILNDDIISGADAMGILLCGHAFKSWWTGSVLDIETSRKLVPHQSATTVQIAISVMAAVVWIIENPANGVTVPDEMDYERVLEIAKPYLGTYYSEPVDWTPMDNRTETDLFARFNRPSIRGTGAVGPGGADELDDETWQFTTFLV